MQSSAQRQNSAEIVEIAQFIEYLPEERRRDFQLGLEKMANKTRCLEAAIQLTQEALGQLTLDAHYLLFDLEATRRERDQLQKRIDDITQDR